MRVRAAVGVCVLVVVALCFADARGPVVARGPTALPGAAPPPAATSAPTSRAAGAVPTPAGRLAASPPAGDVVLAMRSAAAGLDLAFDSAGVRASSRGTTRAPEIRIATKSAGRAESRGSFDAAPFRPGACRPDGAVDEDGECLRRAERTLGDVVEWWEDRADGVEQGFTFARAPDGAGKLRVEVAIEGAVVSVDEDGQGASLGVALRKLRYGALAANDATGRALPARMVAAPGGVAIEVDDERAAYPVTIDPLLSGIGWDVVGGTASDHLGESVASAGDVNGDGYGDVIVGIPGYDGGQTDEGRARLYLGSSEGPAATAAWSFESNVAGMELGHSVAAAGDVNGDGYGDVIVGSSQGTFYVFHGSATGLSSTPASQRSDTGAKLGWSVAAAGDVNGDGYGDVVVGGPYYDAPSLTDAGVAMAFLGSATGLGAVPVASWSPSGDQSSGFFGWSVASAGDVNGDGYADVIVGAYKRNGTATDEGRAYVYLGKAAGLATTAAWIVDGGQSSGYFGCSVASAGDVNADGYGDVVVGAYGYNDGATDEGVARVYMGSSTGLATSPARTLQADQASAQFGWSVASAGDVNGDGYGDVVVGGPKYNGSATDEGGAWVFLGSSSGLSATASWSESFGQTSSHFGSAVASAGDVDGDGFGDVIVGSPDWNASLTDQGGALLYFGNVSLVSATAGWTYPWSRESTVAAAGDFDGDGSGDLIAGFPWTPTGGAHFFVGTDTGPSSAWSSATALDGTISGSAFGTSVASAGDVDGDGYDDVIIGAPDAPGGGNAYLYLGESSGLSDPPSWSYRGPGGTHAGSTVGTAGDVDGDGHADVFVCAAKAATVFVFHGSSTGLPATPTTTLTGAAGSFGGSAAAAGDVNGDGYGDLIVGERLYSGTYSQEGRALVYLGGPTGLATSAAWTATGGQASANFGVSVASAGDVDGDGYADVIVGANQFDSNLVDQGTVRLYLGSATGLASAPAWSYLGQSAGAKLGSSVASAGDLDADGYGDVVVGSPGDDRALLFVGAPWGLAPKPDQKLTGASASEFGSLVGGAGDTNGDGYADLFVQSVSPAGVSVYFGNSGDGTAAGASLRPMARVAGSTTRVSPHGRLPSTTNVDISVLAAKSPAGRTRAKLEVEIETGTAAFDGAGVVRSATWVDTKATGATVKEALTTLVPSSTHHWRARLVYDATRSATWLHSRWLYGGISGESRGVHFRTGAPNGTPCDAITVCAGTCVDGVCCNNACGGGVADDCQACNLDGNVGTCKIVPASSAYACRAATSECDATEVCTGTSPYCPTDRGKTQGTACTDDGNACTTDRCNGTPGAPACVHEAGNAGVTCRAAAGQCDAAETCSGTSTACPADAMQADGTTCDDGDASTAGDVCLGGSCSGVDPCIGVVCTALDACHDVGVCDHATGKCSTPAAPNGTACDDGNVCTTTDACQAGACVGSHPLACRAPDACEQAPVCDAKAGCTFAPKAAGTACRAPACVDGDAQSAATCDGTSGACPAPSATDCGAFVCIAGACATSCVGTGDCAEGAYCDAGTCRPKQSQGGACTVSAACASGPCVDGRCCDATCTGQCEACDVPTHEGVCWPVQGEPRGGRPGCAGAGDLCGGSCDGTSREGCSYPTTSCRAPSCDPTTGVATLAAVCDGQGTCPAPQAVSCAPYVCDATACAGDCEVDEDCASDRWCAASICVGKLGQGTSCGADTQCATGFCVDGVCCESACTGQCEACGESGTEGHCTLVEGAPRAGRDACAGAGTCQGTCDGTSASACHLPGVETACAPGSCAAGSATAPSSCDGAGACVAGGQTSCGAYACGADACNTSCGTDADCASGYACMGAACAPIADASTDATGDGGDDGGEGDGGGDGGDGGDEGADGAPADASLDASQDASSSDGAADAAGADAGADASSGDGAADGAASDAGADASSSDGPSVDGAATDARDAAAETSADAEPGTGGADSPSDAEDGAGCACRSTPARAPGTWPVVGVALLAWAAERRRARRRARDAVSP